MMTLIDRAFSHLPDFPDASLRRPLTIIDIALVILSYYAHAVMAMLPGTFWFRVMLFPFTLWLAWSRAVTLDFAQYLANALGGANPLRLTHLNFAWVVSNSLFRVTFLDSMTLASWQCLSWPSSLSSGRLSSKTLSGDTRREKRDNH